MLNTGGCVAKKVLDANLLFVRLQQLNPEQFALAAGFILGLDTAITTAAHTNGDAHEQ